LNNNVSEELCVQGTSATLHSGTEHIAAETTAGSRQTETDIHQHYQPLPDSNNESNNNDNDIITTATPNSNNVALNLIDSRPDLNLKDSEVWRRYYRKLNEIGRTVYDHIGFAHFSHVFMISALSGDGVRDLRTLLLESTYPASWKFHPSIVTDQNPVEVARLCIWERLLDNLPDEIPYNIKIRLSCWEMSEDSILRASFDVVCYNKRQLYYVLGPGGKTIQKVAAEAKQELMNAFRQDLTLRLVVKGSGPGIMDPSKEQFH